MATGIPIDGAEKQAITVKGVQLSVPVPYKEGHALRANEASVLNQTYAENLRNNLAKTVATALEAVGGDASKVDVGALQKQADAYIPEYDFGVRRLGAGQPVDPVAREALRLAKEQVRNALKQKGISLKSVDKDFIQTRAEEAVEKYPQFMDLAKKNVAAKAKIGDEVMAELGAAAS